MALRVLIIDAHTAIGLALSSLIGMMPGVEVCGLTLGGRDGVRCAGAARPDVALVDAELPNGSATSTIRALRACLPATRVVALGLYPGRRAAALAAGAHAFVLKDAGFDALLTTIVAGPGPGVPATPRADAGSGSPASLLAGEPAPSRVVDGDEPSDPASATAPRSAHR